MTSHIQICIVESHTNTNNWCYVEHNQSSRKEICNLKLSHRFTWFGHANEFTEIYKMDRFEFQL